MSRFSRGGNCSGQPSRQQGPPGRYPYDLAGAAADRAVGERTSRKAVRLYRRVLALDPAEHVIHGKLAPLLAKRGQQSDAWASFVAAGEGCLGENRFDKALSIYLHDALLRWQVEAWEAIASLHCELRKPAEAVHAPLDGYHHFRGRKTLILPE